MDVFLDNEQLDASLFNFCEFCRLTPAIEDHRVVSLKFHVLLGIHMDGSSHVVVVLDGTWHVIATIFVGL